MKIYRISDIKSPDFKNWFGNWEDPKALTSRQEVPSSFAIDDKGEPRRFYHGTTKDFSEFSVEQQGNNSNVFGSWKTNRHAIFFTPDPNHANAFTAQGENLTGGNIMPVYLDIKSPLDFRKDIDEDTLDKFSSAGINRKWLMNFHWDHFDDEDGKLFVDAAKTLGYDGVIFYDENPETRESSETWAVFDPSQIKSATGNIGKYDKTNKNINANGKTKIYRIAQYSSVMYRGKNPIHNENGLFFTPDPMDAMKEGEPIFAYQIFNNKYFSPNVWGELSKSDCKMVKEFFKDESMDCQFALFHLLSEPTKEWVKFLKEKGFVGFIGQDRVFIWDNSCIRYLGEYDPLDRILKK